jgi:hypothetical protein
MVLSPRVEVIAIGLRRWLYRMLARGEVADSDPNELVEVITVPLARGPMLVAALTQQRIQAVGIESFDVATDTRSRMRIMVRRSDLAVAEQVVEHDA